MNIFGKDLGFRDFGLSKSRQSANDVNVEEEEQRDFVNEETSEDVKEQG